MRLRNATDLLRVQARAQSHQPTNLKRAGRFFFALLANYLRGGLCSLMIEPIGNVGSSRLRDVLRRRKKKERKRNFRSLSCYYVVNDLS